jgi:hypothetical protein
MSRIIVDYRKWSSKLEETFLKFNWSPEAKLHTYSDRDKYSVSFIKNGLLSYINRCPSTQRCANNKDHPNRAVIQQVIGNNKVVCVVILQTVVPWLIINYHEGKLQR